MLKERQECLPGHGHVLLAGCCDEEVSGNMLGANTDTAKSAGMPETSRATSEMQAVTCCGVSSDTSPHLPNHRKRAKAKVGSMRAYGRLGRVGADEGGAEGGFAAWELRGMGQLGGMWVLGKCVLVAAATFFCSRSCRCST